MLSVNWPKCWVCTVVHHTRQSKHNSALRSEAWAGITTAKLLFSSHLPAPSGGCALWWDSSSWGIVSIALMCVLTKGTRTVTTFYKNGIFTNSTWQNMFPSPLLCSLYVCCLLWRWCGCTSATALFQWRKQKHKVFEGPLCLFYEVLLRWGEADTRIWCKRCWDHHPARAELGRFAEMCHLWVTCVYSTLLQWVNPAPAWLCSCH